MLEMFSDCSACQVPQGTIKDLHQTSRPPDVRFSLKAKHQNVFCRVHFLVEFTVGLVCLVCPAVWQSDFAVLVMFLRGLRKRSQRVAEILTSTAMNELWLLLRKWVLGGVCMGRHLLWPPTPHYSGEWGVQENVLESDWLAGLTMRHTWEFHLVWS